MPHVISYIENRTTVFSRELCNSLYGYASLYCLREKITEAERLTFPLAFTHIHLLVNRKAMFVTVVYSLLANSLVLFICFLMRL